MEVELLPVVTLTPELPTQVARNFTKSLLGFRCRRGRRQVKRLALSDQRKCC